MRLAIHIGVLREDVASVVTTLERRLVDDAIHADGDGWNCWGEAPGTDVNDDETRHIVIVVDAFERAVQVAAALQRGEYGNLVPIAEQQSEYLNGTLVSITEYDNWDQEIVAFSDAAHDLDIRTNSHTIRTLD